MELLGEAGQVGLEPTTVPLTAECSTIELLTNTGISIIHQILNLSTFFLEFSQDWTFSDYRMIWVHG